MATDLADDSAAPVPEPAVNDPAPPAPVAAAPQHEIVPQERRPFRRRFVVFYVLLVAAIGATVAGVILAAGSSLTGAGPTWSSWKPGGGGLGAAKEIADHVSGTYHLPSGQQLVDVIAKPPSVSPSSQQIPIHYIAVRGTKGAQDQIYPVSSSDSVMFSLCGLGQACSIATGKPSVERGTLVRREILELALYTFKYVGGVKHVIAFMPPTPGNQPTLAVYLQKSDLSQELQQPLNQTLANKVPLPKTISAKEQQTIDATTQSRVYKFSLSQAQNGDAILVLSPLAA